LQRARLSPRIGVVSARRIDNEEVADVLDRVADLLEVQRAEAFRVRAYRRGADTCRELDRPLREILDAEGVAGLDRLPAIGRSLASSIAEYLHTGRLVLLDRLEGQVAPEDLLTTVPTVGEELAHRIYAALGIDSLEGLELAAHDGRLAQLPGLGRRRVEAIRSAVGALLDRAGRRRARRLRDREAPRPPRPSVAAILEVDAEYRRAAAADELRKIKPRRFNPDGEAWLPILHVQREEWAFTVHYSNSAKAHRLDRTRDWVIVIGERDGVEDRATVVTEYRGPRAGRRVVRGREQECAGTDERSPS
jgi:hypothetical protein